MRMTLNQLLAEDMVRAMLGEHFILTEDRIDDLVNQFNAIQLKAVKAAMPNATPEEVAKHPSAKPINRRFIEQWLEFDPSRNKKYFPWIVNLAAKGLIRLPDQGERLRDDLMTFERMLVIPAYQGPRDIYQIKSADELNKLMSEHGQLKSKSQEEREKKMAGQKSLAKVGPYEVLEITNADTLNHWGWRAYSYPVENPNWAPNKPASPSDYKPDDLSDRKWCIRWPRYANSYLAAGPFILVLKNGGPYVGIVWERGECQSLKNEGISTSVAEEIYPVLAAAHVLPGPGQGGHSAKVFDNLKFLRGDVKDGETISGSVDLADTNLAHLPNNLTIRGSLDLTNCPIKKLPSGLKVIGSLKISGSAIDSLPEDLSVQDMEWSEPLDWSKIKHHFFLVRSGEMEATYKQHGIDMAAARVRDPKTGKLVYPLDDEGKTTKPVPWSRMKKELIGHFQTDPEIDRDVRSVFRYTKPRNPVAPEQ